MLLRKQVDASLQYTKAGSHPCSIVGESVGERDGGAVGSLVGATEGLGEGILVGASVGDLVAAFWPKFSDGLEVGCLDGWSVTLVGKVVGALDG